MRSTPNIVLRGVFFVVQPCRLSLSGPVQMASSQHDILILTSCVIASAIAALLKGDCYLLKEGKLGKEQI